MNLLPIVARELRIASRKRSTFWVRAIAAGTALTIGTGCLVLCMVNQASRTDMASWTFYPLVWTCLVVGLSAGLFFTSDCLSEEKREGTLGLLFLTPLRGYDVTLGKLLSTSLRAFYALVAVLPVAAIPILLGGIAGKEYWRSALALLNALFLSLVAGMFVSAFSRDSQKAMATTLLLLLLVSFGGPIVDAIVAGHRSKAFDPFWSLASPAWVLSAAGDWGITPYWRGLGVNQVLSWGMLALASAALPLAWQERKRATALSRRGWRYAFRYGGERRRKRLKRKYMTAQPLVWLACRERWQSVLLLAFAVVVAGGFVSALVWADSIQGWVAWYYLGGCFTSILYLMAASQASRFLGEIRRSGLLELLLVTPLSEGTIIRGQWRAFRRLFGVPVLLLLVCAMAGAALSQLAFHRLTSNVAAASAAASAAATNKNSSVTVSTNQQGTTVVTANSRSGPPKQSALSAGATLRRGLLAGAAGVLALLKTGANLLAICCFGICMGLTSRSANLATLKTIVFVQVIPWFVITFASSMFWGLLMAGAFAFRGNNAAWLQWWPLVTATFSAAGAIAKDIGFILWSRKKLNSSFRAWAGQSFSTARSSKVPAPRPPPIPPVLGQ